MIYDTAKKGLETVFNDYQIATWRHIWRNPDFAVYSRDTWEAVNKAIAPASVSRASIINYLNKMVDEGLLDYSEMSCKGGMKRGYTAKQGVSESEGSLRFTLRQRILDSIKEQLVD